MFKVWNGKCVFGGFQTFTFFDHLVEMIVWANFTDTWAYAKNTGLTKLLCNSTFSYMSELLWKVESLQRASKVLRSLPCFCIDFERPKVVRNLPCFCIDIFVQVCVITKNLCSFVLQNLYFSKWNNFWFFEKFFVFFWDKVVFKTKLIDKKDNLLRKPR